MKKASKQLTMGEQMQRVVMIVHYDESRGNTMAMYWQSDDSHELQTIRWPDGSDDKIIVGAITSVEQIVLPMMMNVTGKLFFRVGTDELGMSRWERSDYIAYRLSA